MSYYEREILAFSKLKPFFEAVAPQTKDINSTSRYFLGYRLKDPGGDLVLFRYDGRDELNQPRGGAFIFHYAGYNNGLGADIPQIAPMHNIRNTFLFEVTSEEYKAMEGQIDMMRLNGVANPFYFSRSLSPNPRLESKGKIPSDYVGVAKPQFDEEYINPNLYPSQGRRGDIPMVAVNCVYLATQMMIHNARIDLEKIVPNLSKIERGVDLDRIFQTVELAFKQGAFKSESGRNCLYFDEEGKRVLNQSSTTPIPSLGLV